jgi:hypothetical protein
MWAHDQALGSFDATVILSVVWDHFSGFLSHSGSRQDNSLIQREAEDALSVVCNACFGNGPYDYTADLYYHRFILCPGGGPPFDGFFAIFLEADAGDSRLIWKGSGKNVTQCTLEKGLLEDVLQEFVDWCEVSGVLKYGND